MLRRPGAPPPGPLLGTARLGSCYNLPSVLFIACPPPSFGPTPQIREEKIKQEKKQVEQRRKMGKLSKKEGEIS